MINMRAFRRLLTSQFGKMSAPTVRVNTFMKERNEIKRPYVDYISHTFIVIQVIFGLDALPLIGKEEFIYVFLTFMISVLFNSTVIYFMILDSETHPITIMAMSALVCNVIISLLSFIRCKCLNNYFSELNKFDAESDSRPKVPKSSIWNAVHAGLLCIFIVLLFEVPIYMGVVSDCPHQLIPLHMIYVLELCYIGHLLNLLTSRLKLINYYIESALSSAKSEWSSLQKEFASMKNYDANLAQCQMGKLMDLYQVMVEAYDYLIEGIKWQSALSSAKSEWSSLQKEFASIKNYDANLAQCQMGKLMDLYQVMVEAYDYLIEGIKWQLLAIIISAFVTVLGLLYQYTLRAIRTGEILEKGSFMLLGMTLVKMIPLFAPCMFSDRVHSEVKRMRELLASRLYENKLDKSGRSVARALLAFTETRDLSFRLLRMLNIDISLPFKFVGLLVTYLIILLQFEKVINP